MESKHKVLLVREASWLHNADSQHIFDRKPSVRPENVSSNIDEEASHSEIKQSSWLVLPSEFVKRRNYYRFCVGFGFSIAPVVCTIMYGPAVLGLKIGGIGNGLMFFSYAFCSLLLAKPAVAVLGSKRSLLFGSLGNFIFVLGFLLSTRQSSYNVRIVAYLMVSAIGGLAQGLVWTAQGKYFTRSAQLLVTSLDVKELESMHRSLARDFATLYLTCEALVLVVLTIIIFVRFHMVSSIEFAIVPCYAIFLALSTVTLLRLEDVGDAGGSWELFRPRTGINDIIVAAKHMTRRQQNKLAFLLPYHAAWGCVSAFWILYVLGEIIEHERGIEYIGVVCCTDLAVSIVFTKVGNYIAKKTAHSLVIALGAMCMIGVGMLLLLVEDATLSQNRKLIGFTVIHAIARAVYENNLRAIVADFFPEHEAISFSFTGSARSLFAGAAYLFFALRQNRFEYAITVITTSLLGFLSFVYAHMLHRSDRVEGYDALTASHNSMCSTFSTSGHQLYVPDYF